MLVIEGEIARQLVAAMKPYRKTRTTLMVRIDEDFTLGPGVNGAISGDVTASAGSWLAHDPVTGAFWPIEAGYHAHNYAPSDEEAP